MNQSTIFFVFTHKTRKSPESIAKAIVWMSNAKHYTPLTWYNTQSGNMLFDLSPKHHVLEFLLKQACRMNLFHKIAWAWAARNPIVSCSEWEIGLAKVFSVFQLVHSNFSPCFLQQTLTCQPPSVLSRLTTSSCLDGNGDRLLHEAAA